MVDRDGEKVVRMSNLESDKPKESFSMENRASINMMEKRLTNTYRDFF